MILHSCLTVAPLYCRFLPRDCFWWKSSCMTTITKNDPKEIPHKFQDATFGAIKIWSVVWPEMITAHHINDCLIVWENKVSLCRIPVLSWRYPGINLPNGDGPLCRKNTTQLLTVLTSKFYNTKRLDSCILSFLLSAVHDVGCTRRKAGRSKVLRLDHLIDPYISDSYRYYSQTEESLFLTNIWRHSSFSNASIMNSVYKKEPIVLISFKEIHSETIILA